MEGRSPRAHTGSRRAPRARRSAPDRQAVATGAATVLAASAWAVLVYVGIRFGQSARAGEGAAWGFMAVASLGAVACLFLALVLGARTVRRLGAANPGSGRPVVKGGKRRR